MAAQDGHNPTAHPHGTWIGAHSERPFDQRQLRRSRFVGLMKYLLPITALLLVALVVAWPKLYRHYEGFNLTFTNMELADQRLRMLNPRYQGVDSKGRPYIVTADTATQAPDNARLIHLDKVKSDMQIGDGTWGLLSADTGLYNEDSKLLHLEGNVNVYSNRGYEFHGITAEVDMDAGSVVSNQPVYGQGPLGTVKSARFKSTDKGNRIFFIQDVKVRLFPRSKQ